MSPVTTRQSSLRQPSPLQSSVVTSSAVTSSIISRHPFHRKPEVASITPAGTNFTGRWVEVGRDGILHGGLKGGTRRVALSSRAIKILKSLKPKDDTSPWFGVTARTLSAAVLRARKKLGLKDLRLHDLRHEATSKLCEKGLPPMEVAIMTGHKTLNTLKRYTGIVSLIILRFSADLRKGLKQPEA